MNINALQDPFALIENHINSPEHSWSVGISGAIAEFMYDQGEPIKFHCNDECLSAATSRGKLLVYKNHYPSCYAWREHSSCLKSLTQQVAFCLPDSIARIDSNRVLTELGADTQHHQDTQVLFDLGLGSDAIQFCIRTSCKQLLEILRKQCGRSIFDNDNPVLNAILKHSPDRVIISVLARIEVYGKIPANGSASPAGPHTHLLPRLLNKNFNNKFIPGKMVTVLSLYPVHPELDKYGTPKPFDKTAEDHFKNILDIYGASA